MQAPGALNCTFAFYLSMCVTVIWTKVYEFFIQIDRLKKRYDAMVDTGKKTGSSPYFEPLCKQLNECFGALKDVNPDQLFSSRCGTHVGNPVEVQDDANINNSNGEMPLPSTSQKDKKQPKSKYNLYLL